jgi:hypothetical protein
MKIVVNRCYGGFGLSHEAIMRYAEIKGIQLFPIREIRDLNRDWTKPAKFLMIDDNKQIDNELLIHYVTKPLNGDGTYKEDSYWSHYNIERDDLSLVKVVEEMGNAANGDCAKLEVVEIPDGIDWGIDEYDGIERVEESHRSW